MAVARGSSAALKRIPSHAVSVGADSTFSIDDICAADIGTWPTPVHLYTYRCTVCGLDYVLCMKCKHWECCRQLLLQRCIHL